TTPVRHARRGCRVALPGQEPSDSVTRAHVSPDGPASQRTRRSPSISLAIQVTSNTRVPKCLLDFCTFNRPQQGRMSAGAGPDPLQIGGVNCQLERSPAYAVAA